MSDGTCLSVANLKLVQGEFCLGIQRLSAKFGSISVVVGRNGSGKSTLLQSLIGLRKPEQGSVTLFDQMISGQIPNEISCRIGVQFDPTIYSLEYRVSDVLNIHRTCYGRQDHTILNKFGISRLRNQVCSALSTGEKKRLDLVLAMAHRPDMLILDEPAAGLDHAFHLVLRQMLNEFRDQGACILIATHDVQDMTLSDRVVWIDNGMIYAEDALDTLVAANMGRWKLYIRLEQQEDVDHLHQLYAADPDTRRIERTGPRDLSVFSDSPIVTDLLTQLNGMGLKAFSYSDVTAQDLLDCLIIEQWNTATDQTNVPHEIVSQGEPVSCPAS